MKERELFNNLQGNWVINRNITNKLDPLCSAGVKGKASVVQITKDKLGYKESLDVSWKNGISSKARGEYEYVIDNNGNLTLYNRVYEEVSYMFGIFFDQNNKQIAKGQYQCMQDYYKATYRITDQNKFTLLFEVTGPDKDYSIFSSFIRDQEPELLGIDT